MLREKGCHLHSYLLIRSVEGEGVSPPFLLYLLIRSVEGDTDVRMGMSDPGMGVRDVTMDTRGGAMVCYGLDDGYVLQTWEWLSET